MSIWLNGWRKIPPDPVSPAIVHGDFKLDNLLLDPLEPNCILAVFDWEMSALGDPLVDLGFLLVHWSPTGPPSEGDALAPVTNRPGWFTRTRSSSAMPGNPAGPFADPLLRNLRALQARGRDPADLLSLPQGQTNDPRFARFGERVAYLARSAATMTES